MSKIEALLIQIACNASSRSGAVDRITGQPVVIWRGNGCTLRCGAFVADPAKAANLVTDFSNITHADLIVRAGGPTGTVLITKTVPVAEFDTGLTFTEWQNSEGGHFEFFLSGADTNQTMDSQGQLKIYYAIQLRTADPDPVTIATGTAIIAEDGIGEAAEPEEVEYAAWPKDEADSRFLRVTENLSDVDDPAEALTSLGGLPAAEKGAIDGVAELDGTGKVPLSQIPDSIIGAVKYQGTWNASTNTPDLADLDPAPLQGHAYVVSVAGGNDPDSAGRTFEPWDWLVFNGATWDKLDNSEPLATTLLAGMIRLATQTEHNQRRATDRAITPSLLRDINVETLSANKTLVAGDAAEQHLTPSAADRDVTLPAYAASPTGNQIGAGHAYRIFHNGSANSLFLYDSTPTLLARIRPRESVVAFRQPSGWLIMRSLANGMLVHEVPGIDLSVAGNVTLYTPEAGLRLAVESIRVRYRNIGTISTAPEFRVTDGTTDIVAQNALGTAPVVNTIKRATVLDNAPSAAAASPLTLVKNTLANSTYEVDVLIYGTLLAA